jgi:hypothetical protein
MNDLSTSMLPEQPQSRTIRPRTRWLAGILIGAILTFGLLGALLWTYTGVGLLHLLGLFRSGKIQINTDQPTIVRQIQQLQRLETVSYTMDKIISGERNNSYFPQPLAGERLLLIVHGEVIAGVNLATLNPRDVIINARDISLRLPKAEIFSTRLDNAKTRVYSRDTGVFSIPDPNLETRVRQEAERQLHDAAVNDGILKTADENARQTITTLLTGLGFTRIELH